MDCQTTYNYVPMEVDTVTGVGEPTNSRSPRLSTRKPISSQRMLSSHRMTGQIKYKEWDGSKFRIAEGTDGRGPVVEAEHLYLDDKYEVEIKPNVGDVVHYSLGPSSRGQAYKVHLKEREIISCKRNPTEGIDLYDWGKPPGKSCQTCKFHPILRGRPCEVSVREKIQDHLAQKKLPPKKQIRFDSEDKALEEEKIYKKLNDQLYMKYVEMFKALLFQYNRDVTKEYLLVDFTKMEKEYFFELKALRLTIRQMLYKFAHNEIQVTAEELITNLQNEEWEIKDKCLKGSSEKFFVTLSDKKNSKSDGPFDTRLRSSEKTIKLTPLRLQTQLDDEEVYPASKSEYEEYEPKDTVVDMLNPCVSIAFTMSDDEENHCKGRPVQNENQFESLKMHPYKAMLRHLYRESIRDRKADLDKEGYESLKYCRSKKDHILRMQNWPISKALTEKEGIEQGRKLNDTDCIFFRNIPKDWMFAHKEFLIHRVIEAFAGFQIVQILMFPQKSYPQQDKKFLTLAVEFQDYHRKWAAMRVRPNMIASPYLPEDEPYFQPLSVREKGHYVSNITLLPCAVAFTMSLEIHPRAIIEKLGLKNRTHQVEVHTIRSNPRAKRVIALLKTKKDRENLEFQLKGAFTLTEKELDKFYYKNVAPNQSNESVWAFDFQYSCQNNGPEDGFTVYWQDSGLNIRHEEVEKHIRKLVKVESMTDLYGLTGWKAIYIRGKPLPEIWKYWKGNFLFLPDEESYVVVESTNNAEMPIKMDM